MRRFQIAAAAVLVGFLGSCQKMERAAPEPAAALEEQAPQRGSAAPQAPPAAARPQAAPAAAPAQNRAPAIPRKLIRTFNLSLEVRNTEAAAKQVQALVSRLGGYVASASGRRQGDVVYYSMTVRVPVERADEALAVIRGLAVRLDREQQQVEDVTDQYIDLDARLRTLEATEAELRAFLAESRRRGRKVSEIMEVYRELVEIRSQIEQIHTQLNSFDKLAALSTINLELVPTEGARPVVPSDRWRPGDTVRSSARTLVAFLRGLAAFAIFALIVLVPVGLVTAAVLLVLRKAWRRVRRKASPPG